MSKPQILIFTVLIYLIFISLIFKIIKISKSSKAFLAIQIILKSVWHPRIDEFQVQESVFFICIFYLTNLCDIFLGPESVLFQEFLSSSAVFVIVKLMNLHQVEIKLIWATLTTNTVGFFGLWVKQTFILFCR